MGRVARATRQAIELRAHGCRRVRHRCQVRPVRIRARVRSGGRRARRLGLGRHGHALLPGEVSRPPRPHSALQAPARSRSPGPSRHFGRGAVRDRHRRSAARHPHRRSGAGQLRSDGRRDSSRLGRSRHAGARLGLRRSAQRYTDLDRRDPAAPHLRAHGRRLGRAPAARSGGCEELRTRAGQPVL